MGRWLNVTSYVSDKIRKVKYFSPAVSLEFMPSNPNVFTFVLTW